MQEQEMPSNSYPDLFNVFRDTLNEMNRKMDAINEKEVILAKKIDDMDKHFAKMARHTYKVIYMLK